MIPLGNGYREKKRLMPSFTWKLEEENVRGNIDGKDAIEQAIYKILMTERYEYLIYGFNYGVELNKLLGRSKAEAMALIPGIIKDALRSDGRILSVYDFEFEDIDKTSLFVRFCAETVEGDIRGEVNVNV